MAQASYGLENQQLPGELYQQAATYDLGELAAVYKAKYTNPFFIIGIALGGTILDIAAVVGLYDAGWIAYYLLIIPILIIVWAINSLMHCNLRVYLFTNGFIRARGRQGDVVRWDQAVAIWEKVTSSRYSNTFTYTVQRADGTIFKQGSPLVNSRDMGVRMMRAITQIHLPAAKAAYNTGQTLTFGPVNVNMQGLNNGKELIPWDQIGKITLQQGTVCIEKEGRVIKWAGVKSADVPNLSVLIALVNYVVQGQK
jgi:hypothetical protein